VPQVLLVPQEHQVIPVQQVGLDCQAQRDHRVQLARQVSKDRSVILDNLDSRGCLDSWVRLGHQARLGCRVTLVCQDRLETQVPLVLWEHRDSLDLLD
jgi:hypothetical protein